MNEEIEIEKKHSNLAMLSFSAPFFGTRSAINIIVARYIFFYETEVLLPIQLMTIAIIFYTIWDMFNDPLVGHLSDRNNRFTRRWGKRFPWIFASAIPLCIAFVLFFTPPLPNDYGVVITFLWFMLILMLFDGLVSTFNVSYEALLPNKFRSPKERTKVSAIREIISTIGMMLGFIIPPLIIVYGDMSSYITMALVCGGLLLGSVLLGIPGLREEKALIDSYFLYEEKEQEPFFKSLFGMIKTGFKQKNFIALLIWFVGVSVYNLLFVSSVPYYVKYIAKGDASFELMLYIPYMLAVVVPVPLFYWLSRKYGHLKMFIISGFLLALSLLLMSFLNSNIIIMIILIIFMGSSNGLGNVASVPVFSDFYDEAAVLNKKRQEGVYLGIRNFFGRTTYILQLIAFWLIHELTGFVADAPEQTPLAQWGIIIHANLIPFIAVLLGTLIFVKMYDLYPKKMKEIHAQLKELKL